MEFAQVLQSYMMDVDTTPYKDVTLAYQIAEKEGVQFPLQYLKITYDNLLEIIKGDIDLRNMMIDNCPNLFTIRPNILVSVQHIYNIIDGRDNGWTVINRHVTTKAMDVLTEIKNKIDALRWVIPLSNVSAGWSLIIEELPLVFDIPVIKYPLMPVYYKVHSFYNKAVILQVTTYGDTYNDVNEWYDINTSKLLYPEKSIGVWNNKTDRLIEFAQTMSQATQLPYVRVDFVASAAGPLFCGFACTPGDMRNTKYRAFYDAHNSVFMKNWQEAKEKLNIKNAPVSLRNADYDN
jgi:hypothetical protein